jgi:hypothetical protein
MKKTKLTALIKLFSAIALVLAITVFTGSNSVAYAAAKQTATAANTAQGEFKPPKLDVVWDDADGEDMYQPRRDAMSYEKAAQVGAQYIWEMYGESIDGKAVRMLYMASRPSSTRDYWNGYVFNTKADITFPRYGEESDNSKKSIPLFTFEIDAATGEWISIANYHDVPKRGGANGKAATFEELSAMANQPPAGLDEYIMIAKAFAQKHFKKTKVVDAEFHYQFLNYNETPGGLGDGDTVEIFNKGGTVSIKVPDDTGRVAEVHVNKDTKQAYFLFTDNSDRIDGGEYMIHLFK